MKDLSIHSQNSAFSTASASLSETVKGGEKEIIMLEVTGASSLNFPVSSVFSQVTAVGPTAINWDREYYLKQLPWL